MSQPRVSWFLGLGLLLLGVSVSESYEVDTHRNISAEAYDQSVLNRAYLQTELGFLASGTTLRWGIEQLTARNWIIEGSEREDDSIRSRNHFYDPVNNRGLRSICAAGVPASAVDWAFDQATEPDDFKFAWRDARQYYLRALTGPAPQDREADLARTFRTLGDVLHLVQDMGSPEHTRNDIHAGQRLQFMGWYVCGADSLFEVYIRNRPSAFNLAGYPPPMVSQFRDFWTTGSGRGFAEFTNRNFVSKATNFTQSQDGNPGKGYPSPTLSLALREDVADVRELDSTIPIAGPMTFFLNNIDDRITGEIIEKSRMTTYSLFDRDLKSKGKNEIFTLNRFNVEAAGRVLLPRAAGYSAALLNYFFRGKLDVQIVTSTDPTNDGGLQLVGRNASPETISNGVLQIYADDSVSGARQQLRIVSLAPDPTTGGVDPGVIVAGGALPTVQFRPPSQAASRYVVVYAGDMGGELKSLSPGFTGAVIGKVLSGGRAEEIIPSDSAPSLRNPDGLFPLPASVAGLNTVQWGDLDNTFVGLVSQTPGSPDQMKAFQIARPLGSPAVPLAADQTVNVQLLKAINFPFGLSLGTTVNFTRSVHYRQILVTVDQTATGTWDGNSYQYQAVDNLLPVETVVDTVFPVAQSFALVLDQVHLQGGIGSQRPYAWRVVEVGLDRQKRLLALVEIQLTSVEVNASFSVRQQVRNRDCVLQPDNSVSFFLDFPAVGKFYALIDVEAGAVRGTSTAPSFSPTVRDSFTDTREQIRVTTINNGGPAAGTSGPFCSALNFLNPDPALSIQVAGEVTVPFSGPEAFDLTGLYRSPDLQTLVGTSLTLVPTSASTANVYRVDSQNGVNKALQYSRSGAIATGYLTLARQGMRMRPASGSLAEILLLFGRPVGVQIGEGEEGVLVRWVPENANNSVLSLNLEDPASYSLAFATPRSTLIRQADPSSGLTNSFVVDFDRQSTTQFPNQDLSQQYVLLPPLFLYNITDTHFHTVDSQLLETALPQALFLAPQSPAPIATYHLIQLK
jgi:hypothetical protein